jgi:Domain of unknown function (DUF222)
MLSAPVSVSHLLCTVVSMDPTGLQSNDSSDGHSSGGHSSGSQSALAVVSDAVSAFQGLDLACLPNDEVERLLTGLEVQARRVDATRMAVLAEVDRRGLYGLDGHTSAKVLVRHRCRLSNPEASRRARLLKALRGLPEVAAAYWRGEIGTDQVGLVGLVYGNPRVRDALVGFQTDILRLAAEYPYVVFESTLREWERLADADGPEPRDSRAHHNRGVTLQQNSGDLSWRLQGSFGALQGAKLHEVLRHFTEAEFADDWAAAEATHGDETDEGDLARTHAQRSADALEAMAERAAASQPGAKKADVVHVILWDHATYEATIHWLTCTDEGCGHPGHSTGKWYDPDTYRCHTIDGYPLNPVETAFDSFHHHVRVVLTTSGVPTHIGSKQRLFTGLNRLGVQLQSPTCIWPGCWVPTSACEADHGHPHAQGGATTPENGAPLCGRHNRWKQKGFTTARDPVTRRWRTYRPDGTEIPE